jgi:hypothetical protein
MSQIIVNSIVIPLWVKLSTLGNRIPNLEPHEKLG